MLKIRAKEWLYILVFALVLGISIAGFTSSLYNYNPFPFLFLGLLTTFYIFTLSFFTTEINNRFFIKLLPQFLWTPFSLIFAFLSGFLGALAGYFSNSLLDIIPLNLPLKKAIILSFFLALMTASLGYLLYKLVSLQRKEEENKRLLLEEHIRNLERQISPHFIFNTLNAVAELVWQDQERAEEAIISLARLLRKSLYLEPFISLEEELELLKDYWNLMSLRFKGNISMDIKIEDKALKVRVPKFSLQILVENALKHGFQLERGNIAIKGYKREGKVFIEVEDNGRGFEKLKEGVGLSNLRERLKLCGASLSYRSVQGKTTFRMVFDEV
ncbi:MAG: sensor histidine kinase [Aquificaceae bacterium]